MEKNVLVYATGPGIGDAIWLTGPVHYLKKQHPNYKIAISCSWPIIWNRNEDIYIPNDLEEVNGFEAIRFPSMVSPPSWSHHAFHEFCKGLGVDDFEECEIRQVIHSDKARVEAIKRKYRPTLSKRKIITIQSKCGKWTRNKDWNMGHWSSLATILKSKGHIVIQVGHENDPKISGAEDRCGTGQEGVADMIDTIDAADLNISGISASIHIANGLGKRSIVLFSGREDPKKIAYPTDIIIQPEFKCDMVPCWKISTCPYAKEDQISRCMNSISLKTVVLKALECLE